jgi:cytochrome P450
MLDIGRSPEQGSETCHRAMKRGGIMQTESVTQTPLLKQMSELPFFDPKKWNYGERNISEDALTFHLEPYRRLGSIYRYKYLKKEHVVIAGMEANEFVWRNPYLWSYGETMDMFREGFDETCIFQLDGEKHQKKRRRVTHGFRPSCLAPLVVEMNQVVIDEIAALPDGRTDLLPLCKYLTCCMTCQALLHMRLPRGLEKQIDLFSRNLLASQRMGLLKPLWFLRPSYRQLRRNLFAQMHKMLDVRDAHPSAKEDLLSFILQAHPADESPLTRQEIALDVLFLLQGGTETASSIIVWALMYLYHNPEWLGEVREELRAWDPLKFRSLNDWPKLKATILEIERLYPPMPYSVLTPMRDFEYQGYLIRKGARIFYPSTLIHALPEIYEDPLSFRPQRFLGDHEYPAKAHATFGSGAHACLGQPLARIKMVLALAHIVSTYDVVFEQKPSFRPLFRVVFSPVERTLPVRFVPRSDVPAI